MNTYEHDDIIRIADKDIPIRKAILRQADLKFFPDNPRVYSILHSGEDDLTQEDIEEKLTKLDHVKRLIQAIRANGGLTDPLIVRDKDFLVLEGNSRLAAYRVLARSNPSKWDSVICSVLPADIDDDLIFKLLGQYHIIGKTDWSPYEQAGYLYRRNRDHGIESGVMAKEMGISKGLIDKLINVYDFMSIHDDDEPSRWSYYFELLRSRSINAFREKLPNFDNVIVKMIKNGEIETAMDIRKKLDPITKVKGKRGGELVNRLITGKIDIDDAFAEAEDNGATNHIYIRLNTFKTKIIDPEIKLQILKMKSDQRNKCEYELKKIKEAIEILLKDIGKNSSKP